MYFSPLTVNWFPVTVNGYLQLPIWTSKVCLLLKADPTTVDIKNNDTARGGHTAMQLCHDDEVKELLRGKFPPSPYVSPSVYF